ncbi:E3 ubiquitin-protein ligase ubr-1 [Toxocara canis]|uniref:E3 ubiquitin-protein ligase n=1 Tax=Toxocara canis TaxID=6265 RepID=A0A0B2UXJ9_TOXCA|nr:E3 ubiquitin-protein ligase ubr-1 [Toxocara canis]
MAASGGSGYCDCGDVEAWKEHPACEIHASHSESNDEQKSSQISEELSERVRALTRTILRYSTKMVCWPHGNDLPEIVTQVDLDPSMPAYQTIIYNDETHTYDSVIRALNLSIHCNEQQAMLLATIVDREGWCSVRAGPNETCIRTRDEIQRRTQKDTNRRTEKTGPLEVRVMDTRLVAMQSFAIRLMNWLILQTHNFPPLAWTIGEVLLNDRLNDEKTSSEMEVDDNDCDDTLLVHLMKWDRALWKSARANFHQMLMATVLMNGNQKQQFSKQFVKFYKEVFFDFIDDDHEHAVSITALTVQVFTVPTIARMLIADESAVERIFNTLIDHCQKYLKEPEKKRFDFSAKSFPSVLRRALYMMYDQKYLLTVIPAESEWTQPLRENFLRGCRSFVKFLSYMQGMDEIKRQSVEHQVWELEWETAFNIQLRVQSVTTLLIAWACSDKYVHARLLDYLVNEIEMITKGSEDFFSKVKIKVNGVSAMCFPFDVTKSKLSIHQPLWRLLAGLFAAPSGFLERITVSGVTESSSADTLNLKGKRAMLYEMPMRYLLTVIPAESEWTQPLRENFLRGCRSFVKFLSYMQGMDEIKRQSVEHQVWELEWETAFNIQLRVQSVTTLLIAWACSDKYVHARLLDYLVNEIEMITKGSEDFFSKVKIKVNGVSAMCFPFDVTKSKLSIHQPLWRLLAGLFAAPSGFLERITVSGVTESSSADTLNLKGKRAMLYEMPMRVLVLCAQSQAQMWRRNGFSLVNQIHNYLSPLCRTEMFDRDILMMQVGAALSPPDVFLIRLLNRFALHNWAEVGFEENKSAVPTGSTPEELSKSTVILAEEMLHLIISIIGERFMPGVGVCTRKAMLRREVLHILATGPKPFSKVGAALSPPDVFLIRLLNRFALHNWAEVGFEENKSAVPTGSTPEELSKSTVILAEEMLHLIISIIGERFMPGVGVCTRKAMLRREVLHILATGPKPFSKIDRAIPDCPLLEKLSLDEAVKSVGDFRKPTKASAGMFSLKKSLLNEYSAYFYHYSKTDVSQAEQYQQKERANGDKSVLACPPPRLPSFEPFFRPIVSLLRSQVLLVIIRVIIERTSKRSRYSSDALFHRALYLIGMGLGEQAENKQFDFIHDAERSGIFELLEKLNGKPEVQTNADLLAWIVQRYKEVKAAASGLSTSDSKEERDPKDVNRQAKRAAIAAKMRKQAMEQMNRLQKKFVSQNKDLLEAQKKDEEENDFSRAVDEDEEPVGVLSDDSGFPVCLGGARCEVGATPSRRVTCILCQEVEEVKFSGRALVCVAYQQQSCLFTQRYSKVRAPTDVLVSASLPFGMDASTCGHTMHFDCYMQYCDLLKSRERGRPRQQLALSQRMIDVEANEYLCPLCKRLSNTALPLLPAISTLSVKRFSESRSHLTEFDDWVNTLGELINEPLRSQTAKPVKTHNRKRSHSERSLLEMTKRGNEGASDNLSTSVPSASALSLMMESEVTGEPAAVTGVETDEQQGGSAVVAVSAAASEHAAILGSVTERPAVDARILSMLRPLPSLPNVVHKIKEFMGHSKHLSDNVPTTLVTWEMIKCFLKAAHARFEPPEEPLTNLGKNVMETVTAWQITAFALRSIAAVLRCEKKPLFGAFNTRQRFEPPEEPLTNLGKNVMETVTAWQITAFALRSIAAVLRCEKKPLFGAFNTRQRECFYNLSRVCAVAAFNCRPEDLRLVLGHLLAPLLGTCTVAQKSSSPATLTASGAHAASPTKSSIPSLLIEAGFPLARSSPMSSPTGTQPTSPLPEGVTARLQLISPFASTASYAWAVAAMQAPVNILSVDMISLAIELAMCIGWTWVDGRMTVHNGNKNVDAHVIPDGSQDEQFAVRLALIGHLYQIFASFDDSEEMGGSHAPRSPQISDTIDSDLDSVISQLYTIVKPTQHLISVNSLKQGQLWAFFRWTAQQSVIPVPDIVRQPVMENRLVQLPEDFSELINQAANFKCPSIQMEEHASSVPTLCLVCGTLLCSQSYCCQRTINKETLGACSYHLQSCSGPSGGMFLRIRDSQVILLTSRARGCFHAAPYVDEFGETDFGFRRGNPLHLNHELYAKLEHLWLHQGICEEVVNQYEIDHRNIGFEWQHF